ncbi:MAG: hypothetical protein NZ828_04025 [Alphaproteobacteria bacterium]|nr:hypothetical protein [Alphaproteobacteria bacterium]MCS5596399.1 hypothetical protein [Alphaproteobacteria bacterium]|tara:strand:- start:2668 stop:3393 length:726 start_codon:yes stop_codon:yes gene_type:complete
MNTNGDDLKEKATRKDMRTKKFMFDMHSFDEPEEDEEEDLEPPPPTFSEEELAQARQQGYDEGFKKASEESAASREQYIAEQLKIVAASYNEIYRAEADRIDKFEREVLRLSLSIFQKSFPVFLEHYGAEEIENIIRKAFELHEGVNEIVVAVRSEDKDDIEARMALMTPRPEHLICEADDSLSAGAVKMRWKDGGAILDPAAMGEKIADILIKTLASAEENTQNQEDINEGIVDGGDEHE